jgi:hypothetical protein
MLVVTTWQTEEVIGRLTEEVDLGEVQEMLDDAGNEAAEVLREWIRPGNAPKSLYDAVMRFPPNPDHSFDPVDCETEVEQMLLIV